MSTKNDICAWLPEVLQSDLESLGLVQHEYQADAPTGYVFMTLPQGMSIMNHKETEFPPGNLIHLYIEDGVCVATVRTYDSLPYKAELK